MRNPAFRRYRRRSLIGAVVYLAANALATWLIPDHAHPAAGPLALAIAAGGGVLVWIWATARYLVEIDDEYQRMLQVRAILIATGVTLAVTSMWGMVELFTSATRLPAFLVFPIWCFGLLFGSLVNKLTLGEAGGPC